MAVDARHLNLLLPQLISNRDLYYTSNGNAMGGAYNNVGQEMMGGGGAPLASGLLPALRQSFVCDPLQPKTTSVNADSDLTCNVPGSAAAAPPRKRSRDCFDNNISAVDLCNNTNEFSQYPVGFDVASQFHRYQSEIDAIISQHNKKMRMEMEESQNRQARLVVQTIGKNLLHKLKEKDDQIQKMGKLNMLLQERLGSLYVENQLWREMAQSNEAAANTLRVNLEQVLAHVSHDGVGYEGANGGVICAVKEEEDAQSCCGSTAISNDHHEDAVELESRDNNSNNGNGNSNGKNSNNNGKSKKKRAMMMTCKVCGERESCVLLLPCRHLCLCTLCGSSLLQACPVCNSNMNATVHVNMSSSC